MKKRTRKTRPRQAMPPEGICAVEPWQDENCKLAPIAIVDAPMAYSTALTATQVAALYAAGGPNPTPKAGLIMRWLRFIFGSRYNP